MPELLVDTPSTSVRLTDAELSDWGAKQTVFVSSLIDAMREERAFTRRAILDVGTRPVMFEYDLGGQDVSADRAYLDGVRQSSIYVGLFGPVYGVELADGDSATEAEFREAEHRGLRVAAFVQTQTSASFEGRQRRFVQSLQNKLTTGGWVIAEDLQVAVQQRLVDLAAEDVAPWVKIGEVAIRASRLQFTNRGIRIIATVRDRAVRARLDQYGDRGSTVSVVAPDRLIAGRVSDVHVEQTTTMASNYEIEVSASNQSQQFGTWMRASLNDGHRQYSPDDLVAASLSDSLFGTSTGPRYGGPPVTDLLGPLRTAGLVEAAVRPMVALQITEYLMSSSSAVRIDAVTIGPNRGGVRNVIVTWSPPQVYTNQPAPPPVTIEGTIAGL
ncbi:hypothetical protein ABH923_003183 [Leifsonia sp. EB41]